MKWFFIFLAIIISFAVAEAADIEVTLPEAGTLKDYITTEQQETVTSLKVSGDINGDDLRIIRHMIGARVTNAVPSNVEVDSGACRYLDLSDANIVKGGCYSLRYDEYPTEGPPYYLPGYEVKSDTIDYLMFCGSKIETLILPKSVRYIGNATWFSLLDDLHSDPYLETESHILHSVNGSNLKSVTLPDNLEEFQICGIGKAPKHRDSGPDYFADIPQTNLFDSPNLEEIKISSVNQHFKIVDGVLYTADLSELLLCPAKLNKVFDIPEQTRTIGQRACNNITVPGSLILNVEKIGMDAFRGTTINDELIIGDGVKEIGFAAFFGSSIPSITILGNPQFITERTPIVFSTWLFSSELEPAFAPKTLPLSLAFASCKDVETLKMPDIERIEGGTFYGTELKCLNLAEMPNLSYIDWFAFYDCSLNELILCQPANSGDIFFLLAPFGRIDANKRRSIYVHESFKIPEHTATPNDYIYLWISDETIDDLTKPSFTWLPYGINYKKEEPSRYGPDYTGLGPDAAPGDGYLFLPKGMRLKAIERMQTLKHSEPARYKSNLYAFIPYEHYIEVDMGEFPHAISSVPENSVNTDAIEIARYDINGRCLRGPQPGLNIVRYSDGTVKKEFTR